MSYDKYNYTVPTLARFTRSVTAQHTLLDAHAEAASNLAGNQNLHRDVWFRLARKPKADVAYELVNRPLDLEQLQLFAQDKRVTVRRTLVTTGLKSCTDEMGEYLLGLPWFDADFATLWSASRTVPESLRKQVALRADRNELVVLMADRTRFDDEEIKALLPKVNLTNVRQSLYQLMDRRPEIVAFAAAAGVSHPRLVEAAAGSRHLFGHEAFAAVLDTIEHLGGQNHNGLEILTTALSNPNMPLDLLERMLDRFPKRLLTVGSRFRPAMNSTIVEDARQRLASGLPELDRPWDQLPVGEFERVRQAVAMLGSFRYPTLRAMLHPAVCPPSSTTTGATTPKPAEEPDLGYMPNGKSPVRLTAVTVTRVDELLDAHGPKAWETFWSLIDNWQDDLASLVDSSISLAG